MFIMPNERRPDVQNECTKWRQITISLWTVDPVPNSISVRDLAPFWMPDLFCCAHWGYHPIYRKGWAKKNSFYTEMTALCMCKELPSRYFYTTGNICASEAKTAKHWIGKKGKLENYVSMSPWYYTACDSIRCSTCTHTKHSSGCMKIYENVLTFFVHIG